MQANNKKKDEIPTKCINFLLALIFLPFPLPPTENAEKLFDIPLTDYNEFLQCKHEYEEMQVVSTVEAFQFSEKFFFSLLLLRIVLLCNQEKKNFVPIIKW